MVFVVRLYLYNRRVNASSSTNIFTNAYVNFSYGIC